MNGDNWREFVGDGVNSLMQPGRETSKRFHHGTPGPALYSETTLSSLCYTVMTRWILRSVGGVDPGILCQTLR